MPKFRTLTGQFAAYIQDGPDPDITPDRLPMDGTVTFTPVYTGGVIAFPNLVPPEFARPETIRAKIVGGETFVEVASGTEEPPTLQPLSLMVTVDDEATQTWSWRAEFSNMRVFGGNGELSIPAWSFRVPDGTGPVDLTELVPLKSGGSVDVTKGPRGAGLENITAVDGQLVFAYTDGEETTVPIPEAVQGPQGEPGPAGADGEQGPQGPQGPAGEIPDLLVGNITDATPTGKNLMLAATEGAARNALGLQAGATAINGSLTELNNGVSNNPRVWTPYNLATYVTSTAASVSAPEIKQIDGSKHLFIGDSMTALSTTTIQGRSYSVYAPAMSKGRLFGKKNIAVPGHRSDQQLTVLQSTLAADSDFTSASILVGTNDIRTIPIATWQANVQAIVAELEARNISPILMTLPPRSGPATPISPTVLQDQWNAWLKAYAKSKGFPVVDVWAAVSDPATREFREGYYNTEDGVHANGRAQLLMAQEFIRAVGPYLRGVDPQSVNSRTVDGNDRFNLCTDGVFTSTTIPSTWNNTGGFGTIVPDSGAPGGFAADLNLSNPSGSVQMYPTRITTGIVGERTYRIVARFKILSVEGVADGAGMQMLVRPWQGSTWTDFLPVYGQNLVTRDYLDYTYDLVTPPGSDQLNVYWKYDKGTSTNGKIHARLASFGVFDTTAPFS